VVSKGRLVVFLLKLLLLEYSGMAHRRHRLLVVLMISSCEHGVDGSVRCVKDGGARFIFLSFYLRFWFRPALWIFEDYRLLHGPRKYEILSNYFKPSFQEESVDHWVDF
jgi:hypothetical protein